MMKMKKITVFVALLMIIGTLTGCSGSKTNTSDSDQLSVVCTIFPQYDWVVQILGDQADHIDITLLLDSGVDLHSYQPTVDDISTISSCDLFIYVGGESDGWVNDVLADAENKDMIVLNLMDILAETVKEETVVEGMEVTEEESESAEEEIEYDEHVWLSLKNAEVICQSISNALCELDENHSDAYTANCDAYVAELDTLDGEYRETVNNASRTTVLFGDRFPFRYLTDDYNLTYYAAFVGCSAETEASFETIVFLANKVDTLDLPAVLVIENSDQSIAETIISNTENKNQKVLVMNSIQSITGEDVANGISYLSIMQDNLEVLKEALN